MPLTPAYGFKEYHQLKNAELRQLLIEHGLPRSGTKAKMAARLVQYDEQQYLASCQSLGNSDKANHL